MRRTTRNSSALYVGLAALALALGSGCQIYFDLGEGSGGSGGGWGVDAGSSPADAGWWTPDAAPYPDGGWWIPDAGPSRDGGGTDGGGCYDQPWVPVQELRDPYTGQCETFGGYDPCSPSISLPLWGACESECVQYEQDEAACTEVPGCRAAYVEDAGSGERVLVGCWATGPEWAPEDLACEELDAWACSMRDDCSALHASIECSTDAAGRVKCEHGGFERCLPEAPAGGCDTLATESACLAYDACAPVYRGLDCTCDGSSACTCERREFARCEAR